jgi:hypothetical protein
VAVGSVGGGFGLLAIAIESFTDLAKQAPSISALGLGGNVFGRGFVRLVRLV